MENKMTDDASLVEITCTISKGRDDKSPFFTPQNGKGVSFTVFHKSPFGWGPISVTTYHPNDIDLLRRYPPAPGIGVTILGSLRYKKDTRKWMIIIPEKHNKQGGIKVHNRPMMPGLAKVVTSFGSQPNKNLQAPVTGTEGNR